MGNKFLKTLPAIAIAAAMTLGILSVSACKPDGKTEGLTDEPLNATTVLADWSKGEISDDVFASGSQGYGWTNGSKDNPTFNTFWNADNVKFNDDNMQLIITPNPDGSEATWDEFFGGELRTYSYYGYGDYEVSMKPSNVPGTTSTFFVCTGNYDTNPNTGKPNPWDEIDIEFLGKDIGKNKSVVQFNYFVNGKGGNEKKIELPFDASAEYHRYGFRWAEDYITWFVDGKPVYRVDGSSSNPMPSTAGRILTNFWCGTEAGNDWMGEYTGGGENGPEYQWIKTSAKVDWVDSTKPQPPKPGDEITIPETGTTPVDLSKVTLGGHVITEEKPDGVYTADVTDGKLNVTYSAVKGDSYNNVDISGIADDLKANNVIALKAANNGTETVSFRVDVMSEQKVNNTNACNVSATQDGVTVSTDTDWGGSKFSIEAEKTIQIILKYDNARVPQSVQLLIDSAYGSADTHAGSVTVSDVLLFTHEAAEDPEGGETPELPTAPVTVPENATSFDLSTATIEGNTVANGGPFTTTVNADKELNVTYTEAKGNSYLNVNLTQGLIGVAQQNNVMTVKVTNNGTETVNLRIDVMAADKINNTNACNASASQDGEAVRTDADWGGSFFTVEAGKTITIQVVYNSARTLTGIQFLIDTFMGQDTTHAGNITISEMAFFKA